MSVSDVKLIAQCKKNSEEAFDLLFQKYEKYIFKICYYYARKQDDAMDLLQEVFIKIYRSIGRFDEGKPILPWIKKITINTCMSYAKSRRDNEVSLNIEIDDENNTLESVVPSDTNVENEIVFIDTKQLLENTIRLLPGEMRMALILRHVKGMSYEEISHVMECPLGTVKTYIFRGRDLLRKKLSKYGIWEV